MDKRTILGLSGEELAARYLQLNGYTILYRNYRCRIGEIDIIAEKDTVLTFVEVKTRLTTITGCPAEAVTYTKQQKIRRTAQYYLLQNNLLERMPILSFDVIEIVKDQGQVIMFNHYLHCF